MARALACARTRGFLPALTGEARTRPSSPASSRLLEPEPDPSNSDRLFWFPTSRGPRPVQATRLTRTMTACVFLISCPTYERSVVRVAELGIERHHARRERVRPALLGRDLAREDASARFVLRLELHARDRALEELVSAMGRSEVELD